MSAYLLVELLFLTVIFIKTLISLDTLNQSRVIVKNACIIVHHIVKRRLSARLCTTINNLQSVTFPYFIGARDAQSVE